MLSRREGKRFLSTPPSRVATSRVNVDSTRNVVSIHATLAGGDSAPDSIQLSYTMFLSTPPSRVATARTMNQHYFSTSFYPRHPRGWRLFTQVNFITLCNVSIHATLAGGDSSERLNLLRYECFYPRHPRGWRHTCLCRTNKSTIRFYPRHPRGWRQWKKRRCRRRHRVSIHATLAGGDQTILWWS